MTAETFDFAWERRYRAVALPFGITPGTAQVRVSPAELEVRFGLWRLRTTRDNVVSAEASGGYAFLKTAGPPHLSFSDRGVTFATNGDAGVCLSFREPVTAIDPAGLIKHPRATLTVADPHGLCRALGVELSS